ncbi:MAG TPA: hypothetical protein VLX61_06345 [Anaerolineales bacterium]|nr:hypothetical protein [Anaerolineales bacterium]
MFNLKVIRAKLVSLMVLVVLIASALMTTPALADSGTPPPPNSSSGRSSGRGSSSSNSLSQVPSGTKVMVLDGQGDKLPLGSQAAQEVIASGDPIWCPSSVATPVSGGSGCTASQTSMADLISILTTTQPTVDGTIWIENGLLLTTTTGISLDGSVYTNWSTHKLTLKGGWDGCPPGPPKCTNTIDPTNPSIFTTAPLSITNWKNSVTISDIEVRNVAGTGLTVTMAASSPGSITLTRVNSHNNTGYGADLENLSSGDTGNISITASEFNLNGGNPGLWVRSDGTITLTNVIANGNTGAGASLDNSGAASAESVSVTGDGLFNTSANDYDNSFNNNHNGGLIVNSQGTITVTNVTASGDGVAASYGYGTYLNNAVGSSTAGVSLTGTNIFTGNYSAGLYVTSQGAIKANNVLADSSTSGAGASLSNTGASSAQPVTLTGTHNFFSGNHSDGLDVTSKGLVTLNDLTANTNSDLGVDVDNTLSAFGSAVTLTGTNVLNANRDNDLTIFSYGVVTLSDVTADGSPSGSGIYVDNSLGPMPKNVILTGINNASWNYGTGLAVTSKGAITVNNLTASNNFHGYGAVVYNNVTGDTGGIVFAGTNTFNNNYYSGMETASYHTITLNNLNASQNGLGGSYGYGIYVDNCQVSSGVCLGTGAVTITGTNKFDSNYDTGLELDANGDIKVSSVTANCNSIATGNADCDAMSGGRIGYGAELNNCQWTGSVCAASGAVTLTGISQFNGNYYYGLFIETKGSVTLASITANDTADDTGLNVNNSWGGTGSPQSVKLSGTNLFNGNYSDGMDISTYGTITLNSVTANDNGFGSSSGNGAVLDNTYFSTAVTPKDVILSGSSYFNDNVNNGLVITSLGNITISNLTASDDGAGGSYGVGARLENDMVSGTSVNSIGSVTLSGTNTFNGSWENGLEIGSYGTISLSSLTANNNGQGSSFGGGVVADNSGAASPKAVTLSGTSSFNNNYMDGLSVTSKGAITGNNLSASFNQENGIELTNNNTGAVGGVTMTGTSTMSDNQYTGLNINSYGAVSLSTTSLTANANTSGYGTWIDNCQWNGSSCSGSGDVTVKGINTFDGNDYGGLHVTSKGAIALTSTTANDSIGGDGLSLSNNLDAASTSGITLSGTSVFDHNWNDGLSLDSHGAITLNNVTANNDGFGGAYGYGGEIDNSGAGTAQAVKLTGTNLFNDNYSDGLNVLSKGTVTANNLMASFNPNGFGVSIDNTSGTAAITLTGVNTFIGNHGYGANINSNGKVSLTSLTGDASATLDGLYVDAHAANITLSCGVFTGNGAYGLVLDTSGTVMLTGVVASGNTDGNLLVSGGATVLTPVHYCP